MFRFNFFIFSTKFFREFFTYYFFPEICPSRFLAAPIIFFAQFSGHMVIYNTLNAAERKRMADECYSFLSVLSPRKIVCFFNFLAQKKMDRSRSGSSVGNYNIRDI